MKIWVGYGVRVVSMRETDVMGGAAKGIGRERYEIVR